MDEEETENVCIQNKMNSKKDKKGLPKAGLFCWLYSSRTIIPKLVNTNEVFGW